ncbi:ATP-binding cassette subfamily B protein AbcA/BmrA [Peribacillus deserti]|uniref:ATP-binding cassette subfamily B protein AbcA/BmrA n=1 Tax=Peribacillus deserti TaxID=673318 RepID=A0ABS2QFY3_9BACI|nr:ABC transporter ATP-binding protein [Peribacillus deserti]MBM7692007.1 ATP-binding cassette subfamily B protein AbcA/BmrA [Peribacillus deserti]
MKQVQQNSSWKLLIQLIKETKPPRLLISIAMVLSLLTTIAGLAIPLLTSKLIDEGSLQSLDGRNLGGIAAAFLIQAAAGAVSVYLLARVGQHVIASLRNRLWNKLLVLPVSYYDSHQTGDTVSRMTNDTGVIKNLITEHLVGFITGVISIIGTIGVLFILDWPLTLVMFSVIPLSLLILIPIGRKMVKVSRGLQDETAGFSANLTRVLAEIRLVKASNAETMEYNRGRIGINKLFTLGIKEGVIQAILSPLISSIIIVILVLIIGYGGIRVSSGEMTAGELAAFFIYLFQIIMPITSIASFFTQFQKTMGATEKIMGILSLEIEELEDGIQKFDTNQPLTLQELTFSYPSSDPILKSVSFSVQPNSVTAIVGPSGSGKTTLFSLLERFYSPDTGRIKLGELSINDLSLKSWRSQIGYVSQESPIYAGTIRENICYGVHGQDKELTEAAKMAYADIFIQELPDKYDTEVGERGIKLSGGQRQRIAIARALLRKPNILMLDEATSSLDSKSEIVVQDALQNLMKGRTTLVIAHRLSTVIDADQIVFLEKGMVTGRGTHNELVNTHELYREFAERQLRVPDG